MTAMGTKVINLAIVVKGNPEDILRFEAAVEKLAANGVKIVYMGKSTRPLFVFKGVEIDEERR